MRNLQEGVGVGLGKLTKYLIRYLREGVWELLVPSLASVGKRYGFDDKFADISLDLPLPYSTDDPLRLGLQVSRLRRYDFSSLSIRLRLFTSAISNNKESSCSGYILLVKTIYLFRSKYINSNSQSKPSCIATGLFTAMS